MIKIKDIVGYENYLIDEDGNIFNKRNINKKIGDWIDNTGYKQIVLYKDGKRKYVRVHRLVADTFLEKVEDKKFVNHINGNKLDNRVSNLEWCNNSENTKHGYDNKLYHSSKRSHKIDVFEKGTDNKLYTFDSIRSMSESLGVNRKTVTSILKGVKITNNYMYDFKYAN